VGWAAVKKRTRIGAAGAVRLRAAHRLLFATSLFIVSPSSSHAQSFQGLGFDPTPGTVQTSTAYGVSADGSTVAGNTGQAFRWTPGSGIVKLGAGTAANAISGDGSVIAGNVGDQAGRWTAATGFVGLGYLGNGFFSQGFGTNFDGSVVVGASNSKPISAQDGSVQAFRWTASSGMVGLGFLPGNNTSRALSTNADGSVIVGDSDNVGSLGANQQAFRWTQTLGIKGLGFLPGDSSSFARGVTADGSTVVGGSYAISGNQLLSGQGFRWTQATGMVGLGFLPGGNFSQAFAVSADGSVIVGSASRLVNGSIVAPERGFLWDQVFGMQDLRQLLATQYGLNVAGWELTTLTAVSADGRAIVGYGTDPAGHTQAFLISGLLVNRLVNGTYVVAPGINNAIGILGGSGTVQIGAGGSLSVAGNNLSSDPVNFPNSIFSGTITGAGNLIKAGSGLWMLNGSFQSTGNVFVDAGTLSVNGSIASSSLTTVNAGGTLTGIGSVGNTTIASGGTFAPGNGTPGSSMTVAGNLAFQSGALYLVQLDPAVSSFANVSGVAALNGTAAAIYFAGNYISKKYTILSATGGVTGTFGSLTNTNVPANFTSTLSYDANNAYLNLALNFVPNPTPNFGNGLSVNQQNVANTLVNFFDRTGGIPAVFGSLTPAGLTQVSGELPTAAQQTTFDAMNLFLGLLTDPFVAGRGNPITAGANAPQFADENDTASAYAASGKARSKNERDAYAAVYRKAPIMADPFTQRWSVWAAGYGGSQTTDGNTVLGSNNTRSSIGGVAVGADYRFSPYTLAGFAIAGGGTNFSVNGLGSGRSDLFQAGAFVRHNVGAAYITGALAYGWQDITTDRTVTIAGTDVLRASFNANAFSGRVEGGYRFVTPWMATGIAPYAAGQFTTFELPAYAEQAVAGANTFALTYGAKDVTASRSELGLRSDKSFAVQDGIFTLRGRAAWAHNFNTDRSITPTFQTLPGASFVVNGAAQASDSALVTGSAEMKWLNGFSLAGTFEGEFSNVTTSYAGKGVVRYAW
jgi:uncharacterized protein with beta-barrel porin domain